MNLNTPTTSSAVYQRGGMRMAKHQAVIRWGQDLIVFKGSPWYDRGAPSGASAGFIEHDGAAS